MDCIIQRCFCLFVGRKRAVCPNLQQMLQLIGKMMVRKCPRIELSLRSLLDGIIVRIGTLTTSALPFSAAMCSGVRRCVAAAVTLAPCTEDELLGEFIQPQAHQSFGGVEGRDGMRCHVSRIGCFALHKMSRVEMHNGGESRPAYRKWR